MQSLTTSTSATKGLNRRMSFLLVALLTIATTGCSTLSLATTDRDADPSVSADLGQYQVLMQANFGKSPTYTGTIDGSLTIQDALERSGALKKYRNMEIDLFREIEGSYQPLKMSALYDPGKRIVRPETNYGLRAGDSILVKTKTENSLGKLMGQFSSAK